MIVNSNLKNHLGPMGICKVNQGIQESMEKLYFQLSYQTQNVREDTYTCRLI